MTRRAAERGGASLEIVILAPFLLLLLMLIIAFARYAQAESLIDQAARDGARAATAQNDRGEVDDVVSTAVQDAMQDAPGSCRRTVIVDPELSDAAYEVADPSSAGVESVTVTVSCVVDMRDLAALPLGSVEIEHTFTSPLDRYRGYQ
jgi:Flp pilus assembly protein TadG